MTITKALILGAAILSATSARADLRFRPDAFRPDTLTMPDDTPVTFKAYEGIPYVTNIEDSTYQTLNIYVPDHLAPVPRIPILLRTYVGGYAASTAKAPSPSDATGRALSEGYVVCIPGSRGNNSTITRHGHTIITGTAPRGLLDLKAAIRYLRHNDDLIPGDADRIFTDGTSAGGAMSALLGATAGASVYEPLLRAMGAAPAPDSVYAAICYCPITDLNHADMEYEWLYSCTNRGVRHLDSAQIAVSDALAAECPAYIDTLRLRRPDGTPVTADNYLDYLKTFLIASATRALQEGCEIPDTIGIQFYRPAPDGAPMGAHPGGDGRLSPSFGPGRAPRFNRTTDFVTDIDLPSYLSYVAATTPLKTPPAFDRWGVLIDTPTPENTVFGQPDGTPANFTDFSLRRHLRDPRATLTPDMQTRILMMNPMPFIAGEQTSTVAPHWYIRHGAKDRDTSFLVPVNLATLLRNHGHDVDFALPWNRPHSGDYNLDDLFAWIARTL